ncbi:MAG: EF-P beta-lysylation protein EpmB [Verrucomicrobia bacterium]|nr:EF-P beta-lysylation protein EpmB [Verrucomicrobiota bacterium]
MDKLMTTVPLWRQIQRENFTDWKKLLNFLELDLDQAEQVLNPRSKFPLNVPLRLVQKIAKGDWNDPVLRQFLPTLKELEPSPLFVLDPVADEQSRKTPKLLHKYHGRALLVCTSACAMHCRYCFRQHFDYETADKLFKDELEEIANEPSLSEILLSGGDPLSLSDAQLKHLLGELDQIPHLKRIRFHTRFPMGIPERIDDSFVSLLSSLKKQVIFVIHCNHPGEFDDEIFKRLKKIQHLGIPVLTQTVLLKGINDDVETLKKLFLLLIDNGIIPYYLHQLDRVQGSAHFEVSEEEGKQLMAALETLLPGYALPKYVREIAGQPKKTQIL